jgi:hypothetical protein
MQVLRAIECFSSYDLDGNCQWVKPYGGVNRDIAYGIASDRNGYICTTGIYTGSANFGSYSLTGNLLSDYYVDKVSPIPVAAPSSASTNLIVTNSNCNDLSLSFTAGNGAGRYCARAGSAVNQSPVNGATYNVIHHLVREILEVETMLFTMVQVVRSM